jgi:diadenosine tetraphosphate (Ap4A) HIT family hydrolase
MVSGCVFCDHGRLREADLYFENDFCIYASTRDPRDPLDVIPACGGIVPKVHRTSPFDLPPEEWAATRELLLLVRAELPKRLAPDGYTLGWNDQGGWPTRFDTLLADVLRVGQPRARLSGRQLPVRVG